MPIADDIGLFLQSAGIGTLAPVGSVNPAADIYAEQQPDEPPDLISLHRQGGIAPDYVQESNLPAIEKTGLQVRVRGSQGNHVATEARAELVRDTIDNLREFTVGNKRYMKALRLGDLSNLSEDPNGQRMYTINWIVWQTG